LHLELFEKSAEDKMILNQEKIGVVLFNLGGPDSLEAVEPFLYNLFQDPDIFTFPFASLVRKPLAKFISKRRAPKSRAYFEYMGGKSPITELTLQQARALEEKLNFRPLPNPLLGKERGQPLPLLTKEGTEGGAFRVLVAMRFWKPFTSDALEILKQEGIRKVILLPLYPQYSFTTTRSSEREWDTQCRKQGIGFEKVFRVSDYHDHPLYIQALAARIREAIERFPVERQKKVHLLFSAHGIPLKEIRAGDPYEKQIIRSVELVQKELGNAYSHSLSYQSRVGPLKWLEPNTVEKITELAKEGKKEIVAVPISFVSDHSETLYELKKMYGELARSLGIEQYELMPALNDQSLFIECLADVVQQKLVTQN